MDKKKGSKRVKIQHKFIFHRCAHLKLVVDRDPGFELTTLVMIDIDCTGRCKDNYHTITITTGLCVLDSDISDIFVTCYTIRNFF